MHGIDYRARRLLENAKLTLYSTSGQLVKTTFIFLYEVGLYVNNLYQFDS